MLKSKIIIILLLILSLGIAGCDDGDDGDQGPVGPAGPVGEAGADGTEGADGADGANGEDGADGMDGAAGDDGISCWDLNQNGVTDLPDEDLNMDGAVDVLDCNALVGSDIGAVAQFHVAYFTESEYVGTSSCLNCHGSIADEILTTGHWKWEGTSAGMTGIEDEIHGKTDVINNFCIAVGSNEARCSQCHIGYGYADNTFDFSNTENIDCLICHDQSGTYKKGKTTAGLPDPAVDLQTVARSVALADGVPSRKNCLDCHATAGGGDNVKHGDLSSAMVSTAREFDVHMGTDGADLNCVVCHQVARNSEGFQTSHGIGGMVYHSVDEGEMKDCADCHGDISSVHAGTSVVPVLTTHGDIFACQVCHIPTFARQISTKVEWNWGDAGQDIDPIPVDPATGRPNYDKKKGTFFWANDVRPDLLYYNGKWDKAIANVSDKYTELPAVLAAPSATYKDADAKIYPFKKMIGNQAADANNNTILVPHLFGLKGGPNPYWAKYDWNLALQEGADYMGQTYTGAYEFIDTLMYLSVNHEVAPKEMAYGMNGNCADCHGDNQINWQGLGWSADPLEGGTRP
jgi:octaheme c-type cytochrome (tetrathionate reductase family)